MKLAWTDANGPVAGYSVYVQREDGAFKHELDVTASSVTLRGAPGSTARVTVVAFDTARAYGPSSPTSPLFTFPNLDGSTNASTQAAASATTAAASAGGSSASALVGDPAANTTPDPTQDSSEENASTLPGTLVWQAGDAFRITDTAIVTKRLFALPAEDAQLGGAADFDADGQGDLLWVGAAGQLSYTPGSALRSSSDAMPLVGLGALAAGERVLGAGDFDGDGDGDVLVGSGVAVRARLTAAAGTPAISELGTAEAVLAGISDFDANGSEDIVWRASTGALVLWLMNGGSLSAIVEVALTGVFDPIGVGDFDGDGVAEIALRSLNGIVYAVHPLIALPQLEPTDLTNAMPWTPVGDSDLDGDGSDELVLATSGAIRIASLPGNQVLALEPDSPWQLVALLP